MAETNLCFNCIEQLQNGSDFVLQYMIEYCSCTAHFMLNNKKNIVFDLFLMPMTTILV